MINYSKPKLNAAKDSESSNLLRIRKYLIRSITNNIKTQKNEENKLDNEDKFKNYINYKNKKPSTSIINTSNDTLNVLKHLAYKNKELDKKAINNLKKINSLIDIKLPYCSNYSRTIKYCKDKQNKSNNLSVENINNNDSINNLMEIGFDEDNMLDEIKFIKEEINDITDKKIINGCKNIEKLKGLRFKY